MTPSNKDPRTCAKGHTYYKSSDCPVCPVCESERRAGSGFLSLLSAPARRALENKGITTVQRLSEFSEAEVLSLHGMGRGSLPKLQHALEESGLFFRRE